MRIFLVQHGIAVAKDVDPERPLSDAGVDDVERMANFLASSGLTVEHIFHSGKLRSEQTANILAELLQVHSDIQPLGGINPNDSVEDFWRKFRDWQGDAIVVGHLPFIARLIAHVLSGNANAQVVDVVPGSVTCLERNEEGIWLITGMYQPGNII